jgi:large subunit ribosomal protein L13
MERKYYLIDAKESNLGRMATAIARVLSGKGKVDFTPHIDGGDFVVVINSDKLQVTGKKMRDKIYHSFSGYPSGITSVQLQKQLQTDSRKIIKGAVNGMLPKNKLRSPRMKRMLIYKDEKHTHKIETKIN